MKTRHLFVLFIVINFGGLAFGGYLMDGGPTSNWYMNLSKAPWTPPGWVFGAAWTLIMLCFSIYLSQLFFWKLTPFVIGLYAFQVFLNVSWNWFFFNKHLTFVGLIVIAVLTLVVFYYFIRYKEKPLRVYRLLLLPYMIWLCIATSLNAYVVINN